MNAISVCQKWPSTISISIRGINILFLLSRSSHSDKSHDYLSKNSWKRYGEQFDFIVALVPWPLVSMKSNAELISTIPVCAYSRWHGFEEEWIDSKTRLLRYNQQISITDMVSMTCYPSGHQIGGAIYEIMDKKLSKKIILIDEISLLSGRYPEPFESAFIKDPEILIYTGKPSLISPDSVLAEIQMALGMSLSQKSHCIFPIMPCTDYLFDLLDRIVTYLDQLNQFVPVYVVSSYAQEILAHANIFSEWMDDGIMFGKDSSPSIIGQALSKQNIFSHTPTLYQEWIAKGKIHVLPSVFHPFFVRIVDPNSPAIFITEKITSDDCETSKFINWISKISKPPKIFMLDSNAISEGQHVFDNVRNYILSFEPKIQQLSSIFNNVKPKCALVPRSSNLARDSRLETDFPVLEFDQGKIVNIKITNGSSLSVIPAENAPKLNSIFSSNDFTNISSNNESKLKHCRVKLKKIRMGSRTPVVYRSPFIMTFKSDGSVSQIETDQELESLTEIQIQNPISICSLTRNKSIKGQKFDSSRSDYTHELDVEPLDQITDQNSIELFYPIEYGSLSRFIQKCLHEEGLELLMQPNFRAQHVKRYWINHPIDQVLEIDDINGTLGLVGSNPTKIERSLLYLKEIIEKKTRMNK